MLALVDCNNFYASCERVFQPHLAGKPLVVLSNNDGCIIARSAEAKALGIGMGVPHFKIAAQLRRQHVAIFSSNYPLYGDLSRRVMQVLASFSPDIEVYSIDECFLDLAGLPDPPAAQGRAIVQTVRRWTGIPVSVGIGPTKTLAKIANRMAKKSPPGAEPVLDWSSLPAPEAALAALPVEDIWGISTRWGARLREIGIANALALARADPRRLRKLFGVVMERIVRELNGVACLALEYVPPPRRQILVSRSFGQKLVARDDLRAAVAAFAARAGEKLRAQQRLAQALMVFLYTNPFDTTLPRYSNRRLVPLDPPTQDSGMLVSTALGALDEIFRAGYAYQKAGVLLPDLVCARHVQGSLFDSASAADGRAARLLAAVDDLNQAQGRGTLRYATELLGDRWRMRQRRLSPAVTTRWHALPAVHSASAHFPGVQS